MNLNNLIILENEDQWNKLYNSDQKLVLDFTATWCNPCKMIKPIIKALSEKCKNLTFVNIDVDKFEEIASDRNISCMPTVQLLHKKVTKNTVEGLNIESIINLVNEFN